MNIRFGAFRLDTDTRQLFRDREELHLTPKALELLILLVSNRPKAVSKTEVHKRLWPETFVTETNLANLVVEIRAALDDAAGRPQYVRTVPKFGYAFIATADTNETAPRSAVTMACWLLWRRQKIALGEGEHVVGRVPEAAVLIEDPTVSRQHARLVVANEGATVEDLSSRNGTWVRGRRITRPTSLEDGDRVKFGSVLMTFRKWSTAGTTKSSADEVPSR